MLVAFAFAVQATTEQFSVVKSIERNLCAVAPTLRNHDIAVTTFRDSSIIAIDDGNGRFSGPIDAKGSFRTATRSGTLADGSRLDARLVGTYVGGALNLTLDAERSAGAAGGGGCAYAIRWSASRILRPNEAIAQAGPDGSPPRRTDLRQTVAIPLVASGMQAFLPVIEVMINGRGPFRFGIETGAGFSVINANVVEALGLGSTGGGTDPRELRVDSIAVPGTTFIDVPVATLSRAPSGVDGVLGLPVFRDVLLTIDYPARVARLERGSLPAANNADVLALSREGPFWALPVTFGRLSTRAVLDTRGSSALGVVPALADSLRFTSEPEVVGMARGAGFANEVTVRSGQLDGDVRVGQYTFPRPALSIRPLPAPLPQASIFGSGSLQHFIVTLDQRNARLRLTRPVGAGNVIELASPRQAMSLGPQPAANAGSSPGGEPRRLGLAFAFMNGGQAGVRVDMVVPGGLAERSGFKTGDLLLEVDGRNVREITEAAIGELLRSWRPLSIVVEREGKRVELKVPGR